MLPVSKAGKIGFGPKLTLKLQGLVMLLVSKAGEFFLIVATRSSLVLPMVEALWNYSSVSLRRSDGRTGVIEEYNERNEVEWNERLVKRMSEHNEGDIVDE